MTPISTLTLLGLIVVVSGYSGCPYGSAHLEERNKCLITLPVPIDFNGAALSCEAFQSRLAMVESEQELKVMLGESVKLKLKY
ncbi:hypothetical protein L596_029685 [Steinernema carpocapsae]|uniref:Uncharacterized protein n=1 Tax=Steinernema carpocapsae TaxID=34508 RepID=A0A4V5ZX46_STECR|nr:hypothetical protein L596_029685 [Steinernema carpocapsae]